MAGKGDSVTLREMVGAGASAENDRDAKMRYLGSLAHTMQDTFANSHSTRAFSASDRKVEDAPDADVTSMGSVLRRVNPILQHADYTVQSSGKHHTADVFARGRLGIDDPRRVDLTAGAVQARDTSAFMMQAASRQLAFDGSGGVGEFFNQTFALDKDVALSLRKKRDIEDGIPGAEPLEGIERFQTPGSGRAYRKREIYKDVKDYFARAQLKQYSRELKGVERKGRGSGNGEATAQKTAAERFAELRRQADLLQTARVRLSTSTDARDEGAFNEVRSDMFDVFKNLQSLSGQVQLGDEDTAFLAQFQQSLNFRR